MQISFSSADAASSLDEKRKLECFGTDVTERNGGRCEGNQVCQDSDDCPASQRCHRDSSVCRNVECNLSRSALRPLSAGDLWPPAGTLRLGSQLLLTCGQGWLLRLPLGGGDRQLSDPRGVHVATCSLVGGRPQLMDAEGRIIVQDKNLTVCVRGELLLLRQSSITICSRWVFITLPVLFETPVFSL